MDAILKTIEDIKHKIPNICIKQDEPLKNHTTFKIGGPVRVMFFPETISSLTSIYDILNKNNTAIFILGNGSNVLASDDPHEIAVINTSKLFGISLSDITDPEHPERKEIDVMAGVLLSQLAVFAYENELTGLEFAHGIPGTLGGAVVMNAGAYGSEMSDVVSGTTAYNKTKGIYALTAAENEFSYRQSKFTSTGDIVLSSVIRLKQGDKESIKNKMDELCLRRKNSQPLDKPSAGSTFKRPKEGYAAELIEKSGLKGYTAGGAQVSKMHAGFIVNTGNATFSDVLAVIDHTQNTVYKQFGIMLEPEVKILQ